VDVTPIDIVLHCPKCALQHIDAPEPEQELTGTQHEVIDGRLTATPYTYRGRPAGAWTNPPHKSHLCAGCGHVWRPSDHPTNGVLRTVSGKDSDTAPGIIGNVAPCCRHFATCNRPCTPRGEWQATNRAAWNAIAGNTAGNPHCLSSGACVFPRCECKRP
jgi:hypothetical protein